LKHPLSKHKAYLFYLLVWFAITIAHIGVTHLYFGHSLLASSFDALTFNIIIALLGYAFGYAFYYLSADAESINSLVSYLALILVGVASAYFFSDLLLRKIMVNDASFLTFSMETRLWRISAATFYFTAILIAYYFIQYNHDLRNRRNNETRLEALLKETELDALKSQINPHFIFNSLNSISSLTITNPEKAQEMVIKLSDFLRYSLGNGKNEFSSLKEELNNISLYLEIEKVRFGNRLNIKSSINDDAAKAKLPNMILQPLFENAIKYGLYESLDDVQISTTAAIKNDSLLITLSNSFDPSSAVKKGKGIGLKNIRERLHIYYDSTQLLKTEVLSDRFIATLEIPQKTTSK